MPAYSGWPTDGSVFVFCSNEAVHGRRVCPARRLPSCELGHECVELPSRMSLSDLEAASKSNSQLQVQCFACDTNKRGRVSFKCQGLGADGRRCHETSAGGGCSWLPQAVRAPKGQACEVFMTEPDDEGDGTERWLFRFDPCGHYISQEALRGHVQALVQGGMGRTRLGVSPVTEQFSFMCPMGCDSFLHDIHHFKACGSADWYEHMKTWAMERLTGVESQTTEPEPDTALGQIQQALTLAVTSECPRCHSPGQKDGACTHISCPCGTRFCYICCGQLPCRRGCEMYLTNLPGFDQGAYRAVQQFHIVKAKALLHEAYRRDAREFERVLGANPELLRNLCPYDGFDASGHLNATNVLPGVTVTLAEVKDFRRPDWLPE